MNKANEIKAKQLLVLICLVFVFLYWYMAAGPSETHSTFSSIFEEAKLITCYDYNTLNMLEELTPETKIPINSSIFFVETACHNNSLHLNPRQACAIESAAKMNPLSNIYLLIPSPIPETQYSEEHVDILKSYNNIKIMHINLMTFFDGTPLEQWFNERKIETSRWPVTHMSDILRYVILWKYGGIYLDLDVIVLRSFESMTNFAGAESDEILASAIISFSQNHEVANLAVEELRTNFKGNEWGWNGPGVITRALKKYCEVSEVKKMIEHQCKDFTVFPTSAFSPVHWSHWSDYFTTDDKVKDLVMDKINNSYVIHVWNNLSRSTKITLGSIQPYGTIASNQCPKVYSTLKTIF